MSERVPWRTQRPSSAWRRMGSVRLYLVLESPWGENQQPYHTGSVAARLNNARAFRRTTARSFQALYWCVIKDSLKRQHHHWHREDKDTKSCWETPETNTQNGQLQIEHSWTLWNEMEGLWRNNKRGKTQGFLQWKRAKTRAWLWFLVHKDIVYTVMECRPVFSRLITIRLRAVPFNIAIVQA